MKRFPLNLKPTYNIESWPQAGEEVSNDQSELLRP